MAKHSEETKAKIKASVIERLKSQGRYSGKWTGSADVDRDCPCGAKYRSRRVEQKFCSIACTARYPTTPEQRLAATVRNVTTWRIRLKRKCVEYKGNKCNICSYDRCIQALEFHHRDPAEKDFAIGANGVTRAWSKVMVELDKCDLLCANCHRETHAKMHGEAMK